MVSSCHHAKSRQSYTLFLRILITEYIAAPTASLFILKWTTAVSTNFSVLLSDFLKYCKLLANSEYSNQTAHSSLIMVYTAGLNSTAQIFKTFTVKYFTFNEYLHRETSIKGNIFWLRLVFLYNSNSSNVFQMLFKTVWPHLYEKHTISVTCNALNNSYHICLDSILNFNSISHREKKI